MDSNAIFTCSHCGNNFYAEDLGDYLILLDEIAVGHTISCLSCLERPKVVFPPLTIPLNPPFFIVMLN